MRGILVFLKKHSTFCVSILFLVAFSITVSYATPPTQPFNPGETLDPDCAPGDANCNVALPVSPWTITGNNTYFDTGNVGIGTTTPATALDLEGDGAIIASGTTGSGIAVPDLGAGTRMMWIPSKSAFRAGTAFGTEWDDVNVGQYSAAFGAGSTASGEYSFAAASGIASGIEAIAFTEGTASGNFSFAANGTASGNSSFAGASGLASGSNAVALGGVASGDGSFASPAATASGLSSVAFGPGNTASGTYSTVFGWGTRADSFDSAVFGVNNVGGGDATNWVGADTIFEIGNGYLGSPSDAFAVLKNGNVGINTATPIAALNVAGDGAIIASGTNGSGIPVPDLGAGTRMEWIPSASAFRAGSIDDTEWDSSNIGFASAAFGENNIASGEASTAFGDYNIASSFGSTAGGYKSQATGLESTAFGNNTVASGATSVAMGLFAQATGDFSFASGNSTTASGTAATAFGLNSNASGYGSTALGGSGTASGDYSIVAGYGSLASSAYSTAFGTSTTSSGYISTAFGAGTTASGAVSTAFGTSTTASGVNSAAFGLGTTAAANLDAVFGQFNVGGGDASNWVATDPLFEIGNGSDSNTLANAFTVLKNGKIGVGISSPISQLSNTTSNTLDTAGTGSDLTNGITWAANGPGYVMSAVNNGSDVNANGLFVKTSGTASTNRLLTLNADGADVFVVQGNGSVGIGTATPLGKLQVEGGAIYANAPESDTVVNGGAGNDWQTHANIVGTAGLWAIRTGTDASINFDTNNNFLPITALTIQTGGNIGIGTTTPGAPLSIQKPIANQPLILFTDTSGSEVMRIAADDPSNLFIGYQTGVSNVADDVHGHGINNTFIGYQAGNANTTGEGNFFMGYTAGLHNTSGGENNFIGEYTGRSNTTGVFNNFLGGFAGLSNTTGFSNNFFGRDSGALNTVGFSNNFFGQGAGTSNVNGNYNNFFGYSAGGFNVSGSNNNFIGGSAGLHNLGGGDNNFIGDSAGNNNTNGSFNDFMGAGAGSHNTIGQENISIGYSSFATNTTGIRNTFIGSQAGGSINGSYDTGLGAHAMASSTAGSFNLALGAYVDVPNLSSGNQLNIGNVIYGTNIYHTSVESSNPTIDGAISIGTTASSGTLSVGGDHSYAALGTTGVSFSSVAGTFTDNSTIGGAADNAVINSFDISTLLAQAADTTYTNGATVYIAGAPLGGTHTYNPGIPGEYTTHVTITNAYALWVASGLSEFGSPTAPTGMIAQFQNSGGTCDISPDVTGGLSCSSDVNLKKNITNLADNSTWSFNTNITTSNQSVLGKLLALNPVDYNWNVEAQGAPTHAGFIAQEVQQVFPDLVQTNPTTHLLSMNYAGLVPYTVEAIKEMNLNMTSITDMTKANSWRDSLIKWFASAGNGIGDLVANKLKAKDQICINDTCVTEAQLKQVLQQQSSSQQTTVMGPAPVVTAPVDSNSNTVTQSITVAAPDIATPQTSDIAPVDETQTTTQTPSDML